MFSPFAISCTQDLLGGSIYEELTFLAVALLLAGVVATLLFLGRSIGDSATSTITTSSSEVSRKALRPGSENFSDLISAASTRSTVRLTVLSSTPQSSAR